MTGKRIRWETMDKGHIPLPRLAEQYFITCRTEGKTSSTLRGYQEKLGRFVSWCEDGTLGDFSVELVRQYVSYLQTVPKYEGHPYHSSNGHMSDANVRNHVLVLKGFSSWLQREALTEGNTLSRLKVPKGSKKVIETLSDEEIGRLFACLSQNTSAGGRDVAILLLFLDTGLRCAELLHLGTEDVHIEDQWLKVMGKGQKERIVPFGSRATKLLQRCFYYFRPEPLIDDRFFLCLDGSAMSENTIKLVFARLSKKADVPRLHIHLLRHTFATRYLMNGGDSLSLQRILGHTTLEMTRRYVDMVAMQRTRSSRRRSSLPGRSVA